MDKVESVRKVELLSNEDLAVSLFYLKLPRL